MLRVGNFIICFHQNREKRAVQAIMGMLGSAVKAWHCAAAELLGRLIINPDNEPFLLPFASQVYVVLRSVVGSLISLLNLNEYPLYPADT